MTIDQQAVIDLLSTMYPFQKLDESTIAFIAQNARSKDISDGQFLYRQGKKGDCLFIIGKGQIELVKSEGKSRKPISTYKTKEIVGLEVIENNLGRLSHAIATQDTTLLILEKNMLDVLFERIPQLELNFRNLLNSFKLFLKVDIDWLEGDEVIYFMQRRHPIYLVLRLIPSILFFLLMILVGKYLFNNSLNVATNLLVIGLFFMLIFSWVFWFVRDWMNDYSLITNKRVVFLENIYLLYDSRLETPLNQIVSVSIETSQIGRWFSYGDINISTYTGRVILPMVSRPWQAADIIDWGHSQNLTQQSHLLPEDMESVIKKRLGITPSDYTHEKIEELEIAEEYKGAFTDIFSHFFQLQYEKGDIIVYRKHWFILFKRLFLPTAILFLIEFGFLANLLNIFSILSSGPMWFVAILGNLIVVTWCIYVYLDWSNDIYIITKDQIIDMDRKPLGHEESKTAPIKNMLSINFERIGFIGQLLNFGTVYIRVGDSDLTFDYVSNPSEVQRELFNRLALYSSRERQESLNEEEQRMADWIETYHRVVETRSRGDLPPDQEIINRNSDDIGVK